MASKSISLSVRVTNEDLAMLSELHIPGALTPSDKLRSLVRSAHETQHRGGDYSHVLKIETDRFAAAQLSLRNAEARSRLHSEFLLRLLTWLPDANAVALSSLQEGELTTEQLKALEDKLSDRVRALLLSVLNGLLAPQAHWYGGKESADRLAVLLDAVRVLERLAGRQS